MPKNNNYRQLARTAAPREQKSKKVHEEVADRVKPTERGGQPRVSKEPHPVFNAETDADHRH